MAKSIWAVNREVTSFCLWLSMAADHPNQLHLLYVQITSSSRRVLRNLTGIKQRDLGVSHNLAKNFPPMKFASELFSPDLQQARSDRNGGFVDYY